MRATVPGTRVSDPARRGAARRVASTGGRAAAGQVPTARREEAANGARTVEDMISTAPTRIAFPEPADGGLRDPDPLRRSARLRSAGVEIRRDGPFRYRVLGPDGRCTGSRRTHRGAEMLAYRCCEPTAAI
jgi:hypothetical protein